MNGRKAKAIRRRVYGDLSFRVRRYFRRKGGQIIADAKRQEYQGEKKRAGSE